jgi:hypothetical protein
MPDVKQRKKETYINTYKKKERENTQTCDIHLIFHALSVKKILFYVHRQTN